jgi:hypothetical protein
MLREWLASLTVSTASAAAKRLGYGKELAALQVRHARCARAWEPHLANSRKALLDAGAANSKPERDAVIFGGGVLADIPAVELLDHFRRICLVDVAFLRSTRRLAHASKGRIVLVPADVTGVCEQAFRATGIPAPAPLANRLPPELIDEMAWVASVNCLTQLPLLPVRWLLRRGIDEAELERFGLDILLGHFQLLASLRRPWCLITEMADERFDRAGVLVGQTDYTPLLLPWLKREKARLSAEWDWWVHPRGELADGESELRRVEVWRGGGRDRSV